MSRVAKAPVDLPQGVTATVAPGSVTIKGAKGSLTLPLKSGVSVVAVEKKLEIKYADPGMARMQAGATRAHLANMVRGVTKGSRSRRPARRKS
jgi:large subunit ribosomal protein L6